MIHGSASTPENFDVVGDSLQCISNSCEHILKRVEKLHHRKTQLIFSEASHGKRNGANHLIFQPEFPVVPCKWPWVPLQVTDQRLLGGETYFSRILGCAITTVIIFWLKFL